MTLSFPPFDVGGESRLQSLMLDAVDVAVMATDMTGRIIFWNRAAERLYGWRAHQAVGANVLDVTPADMTREQSAEIMSRLERGESWRGEIILRRRDGSTFLAEVSDTPVRDAEGRLAAIIGVSRDITERSQATAQLCEREAYFRALIDNAHDVIAVLNPDGSLRFVSRSAVDVLGLAPEQLEGSDAFAPVHPDDRERVLALFASGIATPGFKARAEYRQRHADGRWLTLETTATNLAHDPAVNGIVVITRDVTEQRRHAHSVEILREIDRLILDNTPLETLLSYVCRELVEHFDLALAWVGTKEADGAIDICARAGVAGGYLDNILIRWDDRPEGQGPVGEALRTNSPVLADVEADPRFEPWRARARRHDLGMAAVVPLGMSDAAFGVLAFYARAGRQFTPAVVEEQVAFAKQIAISVLQARHQEQIHLQTAALEASASAICIADRRGLIRWVNPAFTRLTGYAPEDVVGRSPSVIKSGVHNSTFYRELWRTILSGDTWHGEIHNRRKDGQVYIGEQTITPVRDAGGVITHFVSVQQDVTARRQQEERIVHLAMHDALTDLPNRRAMADAVARATGRVKRGETSALLLLDLDNFKTINDTVGHSGGDRYLIELGPVLQGVLRPGDVLARVGGDEFAVVLENVTREAAQAVAERLRQAVSDFVFREGGFTFAPTASMGIAMVDGTHQHAEAVVSLADSALRAAKMVGKNRSVLYEGLTDRERTDSEASQWAVRIKDALRERRFEFHYQPIVRVATGDVECHEALIRLRAEDGSLVQPGAFIPAAERFGLSRELDAWTIEHAVGVLRADPERRLAVNVSAASLGDEDLLKRIDAMIGAAALPAGALTIEITETAAVHDLSNARRWIERLVAAGCRFALDDFGMGFASFSYLRSLPVAEVKIDGSFIRGIVADASTRAIVAGMTTVAHALGKQVVAEWVEDAATANVLRELGVDFGQGWAWGKAEPEFRPHGARIAL